MAGEALSNANLTTTYLPWRPPSLFVRFNSHRGPEYFPAERIAAT